MKILFIAHFYLPHIGGVEKHTSEVAKALIKKGHKVTVLTEKYDKNLKDKETIDGINVVRFSYPHIKLIGLVFIWQQIFIRRKLIMDANIVHIHDVFIWYLLFNVGFLHKKMVTTIHGFEWNQPLSKVGILQKQIAIRSSNKSVGVGIFLERYLKMKFNLIIYGGTNNMPRSIKGGRNIIYVGRLEKNTGLLKFLNWLSKHKSYHVVFCGDGELRGGCEKFGTVHGFTDPTPFLKKSKYCVPGGYLAALEAINAGCELKLFWNNRLKEDYWKMSPFFQLKGKELVNWARSQTWEKVANEYITLYNSSK